MKTAAAAEDAILWMREEHGDSIEEVMESLGAREDEPMARHTTLRVGGPADWFLEATNLDALAVARIIARSRGLAITHVGNGSNLLVSDKGIRGLVIKLAGSLATTTDHGGGILHVGAGVKLPELARYFRNVGVGGLEWAYGVPGCVGGAIFMNAGTPEGEMKDVVESTIVIGRGGREHEIPRAECDFGYRSSRFQRTDELIVGAVIRMPDRAYNESLARRLLERRKETQPLQQPNCGSVFRNPPGNFAAKLIQDCGLKGRTIGGAQISNLHSNFIVNLGKATAADVRGLMDLAIAEVKKRFDVDLHTEVRVMGEW